MPNVRHIATKQIPLEVVEACCEESTVAGACGTKREAGVVSVFTPFSFCMIAATCSSV